MLCILDTKLEQYLAYLKVTSASDRKRIRDVIKFACIKQTCKIICYHVLKRKKYQQDNDKFVG